MTVTEAAQNEVNQVLNGEGFLEVCLEGGGCSGYQIKLKGTQSIPEDAEILTDTILSDSTFLTLLGDATMDWNDDPFKPSFKRKTCDDE